MADLRPFIIQQHINQAKAGNTDSARYVIGCAGNFLAEDRPIPRILREFLCTALIEIGKGKSADEQLLIANPKGRPVTDIDAVYKIYYQVQQLMKAGCGVLDAFEKVSVARNKSFETVKKCYYLAKKEKTEFANRNTDEDIVE